MPMGERLGLGRAVNLCHYHLKALKRAVRRRRHASAIRLDLDPNLGIHPT